VIGRFTGRCFCGARAPRTGPGAGVCDVCFTIPAVLRGGRFDGLEVDGSTGDGRRQLAATLFILDEESPRRDLVEYFIAEEYDDPAGRFVFRHVEHENLLPAP
jgi:hypothetical protein